MSCSDKISADGVPTKSDLGNSARRVTAYYIAKDGGKKTCGFGNPAGPPPSVDLAITKTASATTVQAGQTVTYTLTLANKGGKDATNVLVSDPLPAGTTYVSSSSGCSYDAASRTVTCDAGDFPVASNPVNTCSGKSIFYRFEYNDSASVGVDSGCAEKNEVTRSTNPRLVATSLHVSCSDKISADGVPTKSELGDPNRRVKAYFISKDGGKKTCGQGTFSPPKPPSFTITVRVTTSHCNTATVGSDEVDSNPADNTSTVCVTVPHSQTLQGEIYLCVNGAPSTILILGGQLYGSVPAGTYSVENPLLPFGVPAGVYTVNADSPQGLRFVACGQAGVTISSPSNAKQQVTVPSRWRR